MKILLSMLKTVVQLNIFCGNGNTQPFRGKIKKEEEINTFIKQDCFSQK